MWYSEALHVTIFAEHWKGTMTEDSTDTSREKARVRNRVRIRQGNAMVVWYGTSPYAGKKELKCKR
jgi:hypothetical protein